MMVGIFFHVQYETHSLLSCGFGHGRFCLPVGGGKLVCFALYMSGLFWMWEAAPRMGIYYHTL